MPTELNDAQRRAWRSYADAARRSGIRDAAPPSDPATKEELERAIASVKAALEKSLAATEKRIETVRADSTAKPGAIEANIEASWRRLDEACRKVESDLRSPQTLRTRLDEGRRSMMPKVERLVRERLEPVVTTRKGRIEAVLKSDGLDELREELPKWVSAWAVYVFRWLDVDLEREVEIAWTPREGELPIRPPQFTPLQPAELKGEIAFPEISVGRDIPKLASGIARHMRSAMYGVLSLTFLFGVSRSSLPWWIYVVALFGAVGYGYVLAAQDRKKDAERLEQDLRQKADQATWDTVRVWLDRSQDRLQEAIRDQLHARRREFVEWYRREVVLRRVELSREAEERVKRAEAARLELPVLQESQRNIARTLSSLQSVSGTIAS